MDYFEFGQFRLEVSSRSLVRDGEVIALTPKAFDTLVVLVEEAGRLVTKDELMARVWPDVVVEEGSIANNISMLRKVLNPYFPGDGPIATVARRGYRFTAPVALRNRASQISVVAAEAPIKVAGQASETSLPRRSPKGVVGPIGLAIAIAAVVILASVATLLTMRETKTEASATPPGRRAVAVLSMKNLSGKDEYTWFSTALSEALNVDLGAGGQLRVISGAAVAQMQQELAPQLTGDLGRRQLDSIGRTLGCDLILTGNFQRDRGRVRVDIRLDDITTGGILTSFSVDDREDRLVDLVGSVGRQLRSRLGLAPPLPGQLESARASLSANPEALKSYFLGLDALRNHEINRSIEMLQDAVSADAEFPLAHSVLSISLRVVGHDAKSQDEAKRAFALADKLGREDQLAVQGAYYEVMSDWAQAIEKYQSLWNFYPDNAAYGLKLVHQQLLGGRLDEARRTLDQMRRLPAPSDTDPRFDQVEADWYFRSGKFADAIRIAQQGAEHAKARKSNQLLAWMLLVQGRSSTRLGDFDKAASLLADAKDAFGSLNDENGVAEVTRSEGMLFLQRGRADEAKARLDAALDVATRLNAQRLMPEVRAQRAEVLRALNQLDAAKKDVNLALAMFRESKNRSGMSRALTTLGGIETSAKDYVNARAHLNEAERLAREINEPVAIADATTALAQITP